MEQYIKKSDIIAEIEKKKIPFKKDIDDGVYPTYLCALMDFEDFVNTLEEKEINSTDVFIEKAYDFIRRKICDYIVHYNYGPNNDMETMYVDGRFFEDFKNYMKGE